MIDFPTLSRGTSRTGYAKENAIDPTIRTRSEGGYLKTRPRTTWVPDKYMDIRENLTATDVALLESFENTVRIGADAFRWGHPVTGTAILVRFTKPIKYALMPNSLRHRAEMEIEQAAVTCDPFVVAEHAIEDGVGGYIQDGAGEYIQDS